jgi:hypothetical protein
MNEKLLEVLKKAKAVEARTNAQYGKVGGPKNKTNSGGLFDDMGGEHGLELNEYPSMEQPQQNYEQAVKKSKLPPAIAEAMLKTPINHQQSIPQEYIDELKSVNPQEDTPYYSEEDETNDFKAKQKNNRTHRQTQNGVNINEEQIRVMIAQEISKALPKILENYFDKKIIKENTRLLKALLTDRNK